MHQDPLTAFVLTISDRAALGVYEDVSGPRAVELLGQYGIHAIGTGLVPDSIEAIRAVLSHVLGLPDHLALAAGKQSSSDVPEGVRWEGGPQRVDLLLTTGGTGIGPRDVTPEATQPFIAKLLPGVSQSIVLKGLLATPYATLSRGLVGIGRRDMPLTGGTIVANAPGSVGGVSDVIEVIAPILGHAMGQMAGGGHP